MRLAEVMKARPDGLHIDDYRGSSGAVTWLSACFCRYCMAGFREYLAKTVPKEKLAALGIKDLDGFDYREFLLDRGVKPEEYQKRRASLPLAAEFLDFQVKANTAFVADYRRKAEELVGQPLALCVNSGLNDAQSLAIAPQLSYFCCEVDHAASSRALPKHPVYVYKLADGLDRPVAATASGQDWAYVAEHKLPGLVRTWIALSYAHGQNFMAPHRQWCYTKEKGTHWYSGPSRGVRLALPVRSPQRPAAGRLRGRGPGGGGLRQCRPTPVARGHPADLRRPGRAEHAVHRGRGGRRLARLPAGCRPPGRLQGRDRDEGPRHGRRPAQVDREGPGRRPPGGMARPAPAGSAGAAVVQVEGTDQVMVVVRARPDDARAPLAIHLLNRRYDKEKDAMVPLTEFRLRLRQDLLGKRKFTEARLHSPRSQPVPLKVQSDEDHTVITIPGMDLWAIVELTDKTP